MEKENVKVNFIYQSGYQILTILLPMLTSPYIARVLGADGIGVYSYTYSIVSYFVMIAKLGLQNYGNRCIASIRDDQDKLNQAFSDLYSLHFIVSLLTMAAYLVYVFLFGGKYKTIFIIQGFYLIGQLFDINWFFFGLEKFKITVTRNAVIKTLTAVCVFLFVRNANDVWRYVMILAVGSAISESMVWLLAKRYIKFVKPDVTSYKTHIIPLLILFIPSIAVSIYKIMDKIMLGLMSNTFEVGLYENAEKIINISLGFVTALGTVMLPRMSNLIATGHIEESKQMLQKSARFISILSYALCFGIIGVSRIFPIIFWGEEFESCSILLVGLAISLPFTAIANVARTQILIPQHRDKDFVVAVCIGAMVNLLVNWICIPRYNSFGTVIGTICAEGVVCVIQLVSVQKDIPIWKYIAQSIPFAIFGLLMAGIVLAIGEKMGIGVVSLAVQVLVGTVTYSVISFVYMLMIKDDLTAVIILYIKRKNDINLKKLSWLYSNRSSQKRKGEIMIIKLLKALKRPFNKTYIAKDGEFDTLVIKYDVPEYRVKCHYIYCCVRYGCMPFQYVIFDFYGKRHIARCSFVAEAENYSRFAKTMNPLLSESENDNVFINKAEFNRLFDKYIGRDWILICRGEDTEKEGFIRFLRKHKKVIVKPLKGKGGHGIDVLCSSDYINEKDVICKFEELISRDDYIVEQILTQCDEFSNLNPSSINTVRVVAARDRNNIIHIVGAQLRIGKPGAIVDNFNSGGIMYPLDVKDGFVNGKGYDRKGNTYAVQPGTDFPILGFQVPRFDSLIQLVENAMEVCPSERWVGWDVCVCKDKFCIIEGNLGPGCETYQLDQVGKRKELIEYSK